MMERGLSCLYAAFLIEILLTFYVVKSEPAKGPTIIRITPTPNTLRVTWSKLSKGDSNGVITKYEVCYQLGSTVSDCTINETVTGVDNTVIDITGLKPATMYTVAVRAFNAVGPGPLGYRKSSTTAAGVPAAGPTITNITDINSTSLIVMWRKLSIDDSNGPIFGYRVCYRVLERNAGNICSKIKDVSGVNITWVILTGLMNATTYDIAIRAESSVGFGPVGKIVSHKTLDEAIPSSASGDGSLEKEIQNTTHEDLPESGPRIRTISSSTSTSINVSWDAIPAADANGIITHYFVCYKDQTSQDLICSVNKTVNGVNNRNTVLYNLNEFTTYYVAIQAATSKGVGPHGGMKNATTLQDTPSGPPLNINLTARSVSSLSFSWNAPEKNKQNGIITNYTVCVSRADSQSCYKIYVVRNLEVFIQNLNASTRYYVRFRANTKAGSGNYSEFRGLFTNGKPIETATTRSSNTLTFSLKIPSRRFTHIYVVALKIIGDKPPKSPDSYSNDELVTYAEAKQATEPARPYIASVFSASSQNSENSVFILGDGKNTTYSKERRRRALSREFYNGPLEAGTSYSIFQRVFTDEGDYYSTEWSPASKTNELNDPEEDSEDDKGYLIIIIIIMAILLVIMLVIVVYLVHKIRGLLNAKETLGNQETRNTKMMDGICVRQENTQGSLDDGDMNYDDVRTDDATYTALNRTGEDDENHIYSQLNEMQETDHEIAI